MPAGIERSLNVVGWIVAYHQCRIRSRARSLFGISEDAWVGFLDADLVAYHHALDISVEACGLQLAVLCFCKSIGEYSDKVFPGKPAE